MKKKKTKLSKKLKHQPVAAAAAEQVAYKMLFSPSKRYKLLQLSFRKKNIHRHSIVPWKRLRIRCIFSVGFTHTHTYIYFFTISNCGFHISFSLLKLFGCCLLPKIEFLCLPHKHKHTHAYIHPHTYRIESFAHTSFCRGVIAVDMCFSYAFYCFLLFLVLTVLFANLPSFCCHEN